MYEYDRKEEARILEMSPYTYVVLFGHKRKWLEGKYYNCIFNHAKQKYDGNVHFHKIISAYHLSQGHNSYVDGLAIVTENNGVMFLGSCNMKYINVSPNPDP